MNLRISSHGMGTSSILADVCKVSNRTIDLCEEISTGQTRISSAAEQSDHLPSFIVKFIIKPCTNAFLLPPLPPVCIELSQSIVAMHQVSPIERKGSPLSNAAKSVRLNTLMPTSYISEQKKLGSAQTSCRIIHWVSPKYPGSKLFPGLL